MYVALLGPQSFASLTRPSRTVLTINHVVSASRPLFSVRSVTAFKPRAAPGARKPPGDAARRWLSAALLRASIIPGYIPRDGSLRAYTPLFSSPSINTHTHTYIHIHLPLVTTIACIPTPPAPTPQRYIFLSVRFTRIRSKKGLRPYNIITTPSVVVGTRGLKIDNFRILVSPQNSYTKRGLLSMCRTYYQCVIYR